MIRRRKTLWYTISPFPLIATQGAFETIRQEKGPKGWQCPKGPRVSSLCRAIHGVPTICTPILSGVGLEEVYHRIAAECINARQYCGADPSVTVESSSLPAIELWLSNHVSYISHGDIGEPYVARFHGP